jgi:hypothetical protein
VETRRASRYRRGMPDRKTFDPREKYDHSGRPLEHAKKNDLQPDISEDAAGADAPVSEKGGKRASLDKQGPPAER